MAGPVTKNRAPVGGKITTKDVRDPMSPDNSVTPRWFNQATEETGQVTEAGRLLFQEAAAIERAQCRQRYRYYIYSLLATGRAPASYGFSMTAATSSTMMGMTSLDFRPPSLNCVMSICSVLKERVYSRVSWLDWLPVKKSDYELRENCIKGSAWMQGFFEQTGLEQEITQGGNESAIFGTAIMLTAPSRDGKRVVNRRLLVDEMRVSSDADFTAMNHAAFVTFEDRATLIRAYATGPDAGAIRDAIIRQPAACKGFFDVGASYKDVVPLVEGYYWSTDPVTENDVGRHVLSFSDGFTLADDEWTLGDPFSILRYNTHARQWTGSGVPEHVISMQLELDRMVAARAEFQRQMSFPHIQIERGAHVDDPQADIVEYTGTPVRYDVIAGTPKDIDVCIDKMEAKILRQEGISEGTAAGDLPDSVTAAVAIEASLKIADGRLRSHSKNLERWIEDIGEKVIRVAAKVNPSVKVGEEEVPWSAIRVALKQAKMRAFRLSLMPSDLSKQLEVVERWASAGLITPAQRARALQMPEMQGTPPPSTGSENVADFLVSKILKTGEYVPPDDQADPDVQYQHARARYLAEVAAELPEEKLAVLLQFLGAAKALLPQPAPAPAPGPVPGAPPQPQQ